MEHLRTAEVAARIYHAIENKEKFSLVRMADTEGNLLWAAKGLLPKAEHMQPCNDPDKNPGQTKRLAKGIYEADIVGVPISGPHADKASFRPLLFGGMDLYDMDQWWTQVFCDCMVHYYLIIGGFFWGLLRDQRFLVMHDNPERVAAAMLKGEYAEYVPTYNACKLDACATVKIGGPGIDPFIDEAAAMAKKWDVALVGAGARKMAIVPELAEKTGKVVLDMGSALSALFLASDRWKNIIPLYEKEG